MSLDMCIDKVPKPRAMRRTNPVCSGVGEFQSDLASQCLIIKATREGLAREKGVSLS